MTCASVLLGSAILCGCNRAATDGTPPTGTITVTPAQIQEIENNPNIPADRKAGLIASLKGDRSYVGAPPAGAAPRTTNAGSSH